MKSSALAGHGLQSEGKPYLSGECGCGAAGPPRRNQYDAFGHGLCSCGAMSPCETTDGARKRWHRMHKDSLRAASVTADLSAAWSL